MIIVNKDILKEIYKKRPNNSRKYDFGLLLVIGGSEFYSGSIGLTGLAGFRTGVDMVRIIAPKRAADICACFSPNLAAFPLKGDYLSKEHLPILLEMTESAKSVSRGKTAVIIGGGTGRSESVQEVILEYLSQISVPVVIDADAIYAVAKKPEVIAGKQFLLTPHTYEFFVLTNKEIFSLSEQERIKLVQEQASRLKTTILLKSYVDIISDGKEIALNQIGNPLLTVGGTGDVLAGIAGAIMSRRIDPFLAGQAASYINSSAGNLIGEKLGEGITAVDLIEGIPVVLPKFDYGEKNI